MAKPGWTYRVSLLLLGAVLLAGCAAPAPTLVPTPEPTPVLTAGLTPAAAAQPSPAGSGAPTSCQPAPVTMPALPAIIPGYTQLDDTTGLHYTGTYQQIDLAAYRLRVSGKVDHPLELTYDELRCLPKTKASVRIVCPGFFEDTATWAGTPLAGVMALAGVQPGASELELRGADGYSAFLALKAALAPDNFLAYEWEGKPVPILHGFPVRAAFPDQQGSKWVKWLIEIQVR